MTISNLWDVQNERLKGTHKAIKMKVWYHWKLKGDSHHF